MTNGRVESYRDLMVWKAGMRLSVDIYRATVDFPKSELFGLTSQMRRAAVSVPANIAEGSARQHSKELCQFLRIAQGSLAELETYISLCVELTYLAAGMAAGLLASASETGKMLNGLISSIEKKQH